MIPLPRAVGSELLRVEVGSTLHGTGLEGAEDHDEMGVFAEWPASTIGLATVEHYVHRTAAEGERSQPHDTDLVCYSLRKWARLALTGNPSVLLVLFAPADKVIVTTALGESLRGNAAWFASRRAGRAFLGYMTQQRQRMTGERGRAGRVRKNPEGGVDWKYAMHMLRLGYQGVEFLETGRLVVPVPGELGDYLRAVRKGDVPLEAVLGEAASLEGKVIALLDGKSPLPAEPDRVAVQDWVISAHRAVWALNPTKETR